MSTEPEVRTNSDGTVTFSITLPRASAKLSMLAQEERLMEALNAVGRAGARHLLKAFDADGQALVQDGRNWTSKGKVAKIYETPWGEVMLERHLYQSSAGGVTFCPLEGRAHIVGGTVTPHLARSLGHKYANSNSRAAVRDLQENHGYKLAPRMLRTSPRRWPRRPGSRWWSKTPTRRRARPRRPPAPCWAWTAPARCSALKASSSAWWASLPSMIGLADGSKPSASARHRS